MTLSYTTTCCSLLHMSKHPRVTPPCPHCSARLVSFFDLDLHLKFRCPVLRPESASKFLDEHFLIIPVTVPKPKASS